MTASALNPASIAPAGPTGVTAPAAAGAGGALAGFDALLAALFPQGAPQGGPVAEAGAPGAPQTVPMLAPAADIDDAPADAQAAATETDTNTADTADTLLAGPADPDAEAAAAIAASLMAAQPAAVQPAVTAATDASAQTPHAWGRDKVKGAPAQPAILNANPKADLAGKAELAGEAADDDGFAPFADAPGKTGSAPAAQPTPSPSARPAAQAAAAPAPSPGPPTLPPAADATVDVAAAPPAPPPPAEPTPLENAPPALQAQAMAAGQTARAEPAPQPGARPTRSERGKGATAADASSALKPLEAADKPVHAKAVDGAAKAAAASVEAAETKAPETEASADADAPDASLPAESRAASQSAAPAAHTAHAVRGSPETVANLAAQMIKKLEGRSTRFDLELNPQGLGRVDVRIEIGAHGHMTAAMLFDNASAAQDVKSRAAELQRALEQAGFDLSGGISFDVAGDRGQQQGQAWQDQGDTGHAFRGQAFRAALETAGEVADAATHGALRLRRGVNAGLDLRI